MAARFLATPPMRREPMASTRACSTASNTARACWPPGTALGETAGSGRAAGEDRINLVAPKDRLEAGNAPCARTPLGAEHEAGVGRDDDSHAAHLAGNVDDRTELRDGAVAGERDQDRTEPVRRLHVALGHFPRTAHKFGAAGVDPTQAHHG